MVIARLACAAVCLAAASIALADVSLDGSTTPDGLGWSPEPVLVDGRTVLEVPSSRGATGGTTLLHSFEALGLEAHEDLLLSDDLGIADTLRTVISRVTGGELSRIDGRIRSTVGTADVLLLNPAGIVFGPSGAIDVPGSFKASTAHEIALGARRLPTGRPEPLAADTLVSDPSAFGFLDAPIGEIRVEGAQLQVGSVELAGADSRVRTADLWLVGGAIDMEGGFLSALGGDVALVSVASQGTVDQIGGAASELTLDGFASRGDVRVAGEATVSASTLPPVRLEDLSHDQLVGPLGSLTFAPGAETVEVGQDATGRTIYFRPAILPLGSGGITVRARDLRVERSDLRSVTPGRLDAGDIDVELTGDLELVGGSEFDSGLLARSGGVPFEGTIDLWRFGGEGSARIEGELTAEGSGGAIRVTADEVHLSEGALLSSSAASRGNGGEIDVRARVMELRGDATAPEDASGILTNARSPVPGTGHAGSIHIAVDELLRLEDQARIVALSEGQGRGGDVSVSAARVEVLGGAVIDASTFATAPGAPPAAGRGGEVEVSAELEIVVSGSGPERPSRIGTTSQNSTGDAGSTLLTAERIEIADRGEVRGLTTGSGAGGDVTLRAGEVVVRDGARLAAESTGTGDGGNVRIERARSVEILEGAALAVDALDQGGGIGIEASDLVHVRDSDLVASVDGGVGSLGGNIDIDPRFVVLDGARILARATVGQGGNIRIRADHFFNLRGSRIDASSDVGIDGTVELLTSEVDLEGAVIDLPDSFADASALLRDRCALRDSTDAGRFLVLGREALPPSPDLPLPELPADADELAVRARGAIESALARLDARGEPPEVAEQALGEARELAVALDDPWPRLRLARGLERAEAQSAGIAGLYADAARLAEATGDWLAASYAWGHLAGLYAREARLDEALVGTRRALVAAGRAGSAEARYRWQWQAGQLWLERDELDRALVALRGAAHTLAGLRLELAGDDADPRAFARAFPTVPVVRTLADALLRRAERTEDPQERAGLLREARAAVESGGLAELEDYFGDVCLTAERRRPVSELPGALLIRPVVLDDRIELIVSEGAAIDAVRVDVTAAELDRVADRLRLDLRDRTSPAYRGVAAKLYDWLVRPLAPRIERAQPSVLVFALPASLRGIPMAALMDRDTRRFLIEEHAVAIAAGLTLVEPRPLDPEQRSMLRAGLTRAVQGFPALAAVGEEIHTLEGLFPGETLLDERFVVDGLERSLRERTPGLVHLASHAQFGGSIDDAFVLTYEDRLRADRLASLVRGARVREPIELLTMSACQTASGDDRAVLGIAGVALQAGARSTLASLWYVDDRAAARLVAHFYRALDAGATRAAALREAQLELLRDPTHHHPVDWSAFVLIGSWL